MKRILKTFRVKPHRSASHRPPKGGDVVGVNDATPPTDEDYQDPGVEAPHHPEEAGDANVYEELERYYPSSSPVRATPPPPPPSRAEETRNLVKKFIADIWNRGAVDMIPTICSPALRFNGTTGFDRVGHEGLARMVATIREALDEYHCEIHSMVVEDNKAFCRLRFTGKHVGPLLGVPATHQTVAWMGATEFTCQNGKILKVWELGDVKSLEEQLLRK